MSLVPYGRLAQYWRRNTTTVRTQYPRNKIFISKSNGFCIRKTAAQAQKEQKSKFYYIIISGLFKKIKKTKKLVLYISVKTDETKLTKYLF